jgi:hypothetical protein
VANCLHDLGRLSSAEARQRQAGVRLADALGPTHPDTLISKADLAVILHANDRLDEASKLREQILAELATALGEHHPSVAELQAWRLQDRDLEPQPT